MSLTRPTIEARFVIYVRGEEAKRLTIQEGAQLMAQALRDGVEPEGLERHFLDELRRLIREV